MRTVGFMPVAGGPQTGLLRAPVINSIIHGDCVTVMKRMADASIDFILTDPPYLCGYRSRDGRTVRNDCNSVWVRPAYREMYRVLKPDAMCLTFYGWQKADVFIDAWQAAGFRMVGHLVFRKRYASSSRFVQSRHEQAYLLAKGDAPLPQEPPADVIDWIYTGNQLHPTQKSAAMLRPLIEAFCPVGGVVLDPFCGSGSTLVAAQKSARSFIGIELDQRHHETATQQVCARRFGP